MEKTSDFLFRKGWMFLVFIGVMGILAFFFLKPERLIREKCDIEGFGCSSMKISYEREVLTLVLENSMAKGIMIKKLETTGSVKCSKTFDDGWGPFVAGVHLSPKEKVKVSAECSGIGKEMVNSGNMRLETSVEYYPDDLSEAYSSKASGNIFITVSP